MLNGKKIYYSISEVCTLTGLEPHVLRYWESEFSQLRPKKNRAGNRAYREKDIEMVQYIRKLLYEEKFTIPGAKKRLAESRLSADSVTLKPEVAADVVPPPVSVPAVDNGKLQEVRQELTELLELLSR